MGEVVNIYLEHVRSFADAHTIPLRPLTLLVGENSSGKSTLLAAAACIFDASRFPVRPGFNVPPFNLGTFETIATFKGGKYGRDESFSLGFSAGTEGRRGYRDLRATYARDRGKLALIRFTGKSEAGHVELRPGNDRLDGQITLAPQGDFPSVELAFKNSTEAYRALHQAGFHQSFASVVLAGLAGRPTIADRATFSRLLSFADSLSQPFDQLFPFAPIRMKPQRTYDELSEDYSPEGEHVPRLLARLLNEEPLSETGQKVRDALDRFGKESGLFRNIEVKKLGKGPEDPFQVQVTVGGPKVNLSDVGYGVSQALPVIVQSVIRRKNSLLLIQQPEVHLHPRAQAALGTFFSELVAAGNDTVLLETHSDYLVDRVRQEVARGTLRPSQVQILYFHKPKIETRVYPIELDRSGNVLDAPPVYREFFLQEELRLLKRAGV